MIPQSNERNLSGEASSTKKSNAGRKAGTSNKPGSKKPRPKPKHLINQPSVSNFFASNPTLVDESLIPQDFHDQCSQEKDKDLAESPEKLSANISEIEQCISTVNLHNREDTSNDGSSDITNQICVDQGNASSIGEIETENNDIPVDDEEQNTLLNEESEDTTNDLSEEQVEVIEETITAIPEGGWLDKYLAGIQDSFKDRTPPKNYIESKSYWIDPGNASFTLTGGNLDPVSLYKPRVFVWLPHHLIKAPLICPNCDKELSPMECVVFEGSSHI